MENDIKEINVGEYEKMWIGVGEVIGMAHIANMISDRITRNHYGQDAVKPMADLMKDISKESNELKMNFKFNKKELTDSKTSRLIRQVRILMAIGIIFFISGIMALIRSSYN